MNERETLEKLRNDFGILIEQIMPLSESNEASIASMTQKMIKQYRKWIKMIDQSLENSKSLEMVEYEMVVQDNWDFKIGDIMVTIPKEKARHQWEITKQILDIFFNSNYSENK